MNLAESTSHPEMKNKQDALDIIEIKCLFINPFGVGNCHKMPLHTYWNAGNNNPMG